METLVWCKNTPSVYPCIKQTNKNCNTLMSKTWVAEPDVHKNAQIPFIGSQAVSLSIVKCLPPLTGHGTSARFIWGEQAEFATSIFTTTICKQYSCIRVPKKLTIFSTWYVFYGKRQWIDFIWLWTHAAPQNVLLNSTFKMYFWIVHLLTSQKDKIWYIYPDYSITVWKYVLAFGFFI